MWPFIGTGLYHLYLCRGRTAWNTKIILLIASQMLNNRFTVIKIESIDLVTPLFVSMEQNGSFLFAFHFGYEFENVEFNMINMRNWIGSSIKRIHIWWNDFARWALWQRCDWAHLRNISQPPTHIWKVVQVIYYIRMVMYAQTHVNSQVVPIYFSKLNKLTNNICILNIGFN